MDFSFAYADKTKMEETLPILFEILYSNMSQITPTGNSYENDRREWLSNLIPAMQKEPRHIILFYANGALAGYFQYYINAGAFMMEEMQIRRPYQGTGLFCAFFSWLVERLPKEIKTVEAYSDKANDKSQAILEHLGLVRSGENKNGNAYYYRGDYAALLEKYAAR